MAFYDGFDRLDRLRLILENPKAWSMSEKDVGAIQMAVDVLELLVHADRSHDGDIEMYDVDSAETPKMLCVGASDEHYGESAFECFVKGAEALRLLNAESA